MDWQCTLNNTICTFFFSQGRISTSVKHPWEKGKHLSVALVGNITKAVDQATTPVVFSRGLGTDGKWTQEGAWGTEGGFIGFLDGQVRWYKNLSDDDGKLSKEGEGATSIDAVVTGVGGKIFDTSTGDVDQN
jgi:hypothetical protein